MRSIRGVYSTERIGVSSEACPRGRTGSSKGSSAELPQGIQGSAGRPQGGLCVRCQRPDVKQEGPATLSEAARHLNIVYEHRECSSEFSSRIGLSGSGGAHRRLHSPPASSCLTFQMFTTANARPIFIPHSPSSFASAVFKLP